MRSTRLGLYGLFATACLGCPGTIDDPSAYEGYQRPSSFDESDAGSEPVVETEVETGNDAAVAMDAWTAQPSDSGAPGWSEAGATSGSDGGGNTAPLADAGAKEAEAGPPLCNFKALMTMKCGNAGCHGGGPQPAAGLDLVSEGLADRFSGRNASDGCEQYLMIDTANPAQSALYLKVTGSACGVRMPIGGSLNATEQACILQWIENL